MTRPEALAALTAAGCPNPDAALTSDDPMVWGLLVGWWRHVGSPPAPSEGVAARGVAGGGEKPLAGLGERRG